MNIVLASGFLFPQHALGLNYFRGVQDHLEKAGHQVLPPDVQPLAGVDARARRLADAINTRFGTSPVHIIAHSMGGLDSRVMIGNNYSGLGEAGRVLSLTTLSTPHKGSPVADLMAGHGPEDKRRKFLAALAKIGVDIGALKDLTTDVNETIPDVAASHKDIRVRSYAASGRVGSRPTAFLLLPAYDFVKDRTGQDNDSVVTVASATYGEFKGTWPCDHLQMVGYDLDTMFLSGTIRKILGAVGLAPAEFDHLARFDEIVRDLQAIEAGRSN